jgi:hypothetical protein
MTRQFLNRAVMTLLLSGCGGGAISTKDGDANGTGGASASGGAAASGGTPATGGATGAGGASACTACTSYGTPMMTGRVQVADLDNLSGMAVSWKNPGVLFAHNDMTQAHVFALAPDGRLLARYSLSAAGAVDIEDIGVGPCDAAGGTCLFLSDIGGNLGARADFAIFRLAEPQVPVTANATAMPVTFERFSFTYPDGQHNAEGLLVEPKTGALYVVTKVAAGMPSAVYALPHPLAASGNMARKVADLPVPKSGDSPATSASAHPCGLGFLLRTGERVYEFRIAVGAAFETAFAAAPVSLASATEPQSEAISYRPDGRGYFSSGETPSAPIFEAACP